MVSSAAETCVPLTQDMIRTIGLAMSFLTLCCKTFPRLCCGISVSALLSTVAVYVSRMDTYLSCHLLTLLSSLGSSRGNKSLNIGYDKIPWEIGLSRPRSDILMACKSAHINKFSISNLRVAQHALHLAYWLGSIFEAPTHLLLSKSGTT